MNTALMETNSRANATAEMEGQYSLQTHLSLRQPQLMPIAGPKLHEIFDRFYQTLETDWLTHVFIGTCFETTLPIAGHRKGG
jgi:hypothetical protein